MAFTTGRIWSNILVPPRTKAENVVVDALSCLEIDNLKIKEDTEEALKIHSGLENSITSNFNETFSMHTALIFKEQAKVKELGLREKGLA
jgi:hypothetical protein